MDARRKFSQWSHGLRFIQLMKKRVHHLGIKTTLYETLFGCKIKIGLNTSDLEVIRNIKTEEVLVAMTERETIKSATTTGIELENSIQTIKTNNENAISLQKNYNKSISLG